jgi:hypothetical protein
LSQGGEVGNDAVEHRLIVIHQIHLVHRQHQLADAQQGCDGGVAAGLHQQALARVHQQDRHIGGRGAGDHVAGVLVMPRRVGQDEAAARGFEETVGDVDGDALLPLGGQAVHQQRVIDAAGHRAEPLAVTLQRRHQIVGNGAAFEQQAADQGGFAVIDAAAGKDAK